MRLASGSAPDRSAVRLGHVSHRSLLDCLEATAWSDPTPLRFPGLDGFRVLPTVPFLARARQGVGKRLPAVIEGSDLRADAISRLRDKMRAAGVGHLLTFAVRDLNSLQVPEGQPGMLICNPPYGERLGERELNPLASLLRNTRSRPPCASVVLAGALCVFTGNQRLLGAAFPCLSKRDAPF